MKDRHQTPPFSLRLTPELRDWLKHKAIDNRRSLNSEIEFRLERSRQEEQREAA